MAKEYEYVIPTDSGVATNSITTSNTGDYWPNNTWYSYTYSSKIYMYQIFCPKPRCKGVTWGEIGSTVVCAKCFSTIKIVSSPTPKHDYEVEVS